jgi:hypothetical protein
MFFLWVWNWVCRNYSILHTKDFQDKDTEEQILREEGWCKKRLEKNA